MGTATCNGKCDQYRSDKRWQGVPVEERAHAYCAICEVPMDWRGRNCPCCNGILRHTSRNSKSRGKRLIQVIRY